MTMMPSPSDETLHYPNLAGCSITLKSPNMSGGGVPPISLPKECRSAVNVTIPPVYDFALERKILKKKEDREKDVATTESGNQDQLERAVLVKMKSVTGADDDVCIALLESHSYDLKTSIESFFQSRT